ncbi:hypothetical protein SCP_1702890 [Sparassis crispa]|uniref:Uncharacterized protein n=1 Tax=Sparassis crispa TaxID=139825 RepID=A0A401H6G3_9APHY|nr:hypothetical protein SCP_1702890 [Sparassis crispa]GBE89963.1 hypothetical protein SCP_1702890 [Sparassis crispa]
MADELRAVRVALGSPVLIGVGHGCSALGVLGSVGISGRLLMRGLSGPSYAVHGDW